MTRGTDRDAENKSAPTIDNRDGRNRESPNSGESSARRAFVPAFAILFSPILLPGLHPARSPVALTVVRIRGIASSSARGLDGVSGAPLRRAP